MFEERYNRMMESVEPSQELVRRTKDAAQSRKVKTGAWKPVMVCVLCVMMVAGAAMWRVVHEPDTSQVAAQPTPTAAPAPANVPSVLECTYDGMTLRYLTSWKDDAKLYVILSAEGEKLPEQLTLSLVTGSGVKSNAEQISSTPIKNRSIFLAEFILDSAYTEAQQSVFPHLNGNALDLGQSINIQLVGYSYDNCIPLEEALPVNTIPVSPAIQRMSRQELINGYENKDFMTYCYTGYPVLTAGEVICAPFEDCAVVAAGYVDNRLNILLRKEAENQRDGGYVTGNHSISPYLRKNDHTVSTFDTHLHAYGISYYECFFWLDETEQYLYQNYVFDFSRDEIEEIGEDLEIFLCGSRIISLPDGAEPPMSLTFTLGE